MKKLIIPGRSLGKIEQKMIIGGTYSQCLTVAEPCVDNIQCCSNNCYFEMSSPTGFICGYPVDYEDPV